MFVVDLETSLEMIYFFYGFVCITQEWLRILKINGIVIIDPEEIESQKYINEN